MPQADGQRLRAALAVADEAAVIALACNDDAAAFEELVRRRQSQVRQLLRRLCGDASLADDLAQETFVRAWRGLRTLQASGAFWGWLRRIAVRTWAQHLERQKIRFSQLDADAVDAGESGAVTAGGPPQGLTQEDRHDLNTALARLAPAARACMILAYQAGMSHSEIAEAIGLPLGTVKTHITRSTQALRAWLGNDTRA